MEPYYIDTISSKSRGRVTLDFNRGLRIYLKMSRTTLPHKIPVIFIAVSDGVQYAGGVNALELFQESIKLKQSSSIAREHSKLTSSAGHDGALVLYKLRFMVEKVPINREKMTTDVNCRATDIFRRNEQYRQIYRDLSAQVSFLEAKVDQMRTTQKNQTQVKFQRKAVEPQYETYRPKASFENRSRPPLEFQFEDEQKPKRRNRQSDSGSVIGFSDSNSNKLSSQASFEIIDDSDNRRNKGKRNRKNKHGSSDSSIEEYPIDESFGSSVGIEDVSGGDASFGGSNNSIEDVVDVEADAENGSAFGSDDIVEEVDSDSDSGKKKKKSSSKAKKKSDSFESIGSFSDDISDNKLSEDKKSKSSNNSSNLDVLLSETSESRKQSSNPKSKKNSSDSKSKRTSSDSRSKKTSSSSKSKKKSSSNGTLSDFKSDNSSAAKSPDFDSFSGSDKEDKKKSGSADLKSEPSDVFASDGSF